ncbi:MAG: dihydropteroate synthase [Candidatus Omnitrophica bacterium]|nr:dihydropteroate synthase [Candidatus Omnitrophota bacterium]
MGIVNLTFDSFSGDGLYSKAQNSKIKIQDYVLEYVHNLIREGADIIDIGGQSTRPYSRPIPLKEEIERTIPVIKRLAKSIKVPISIDTYRAEVAKQALDNGALIVNDITGLRDPKMLKVVKRYNAGVVIMHMKGMPSTMQINPKYRSLIDEIIEFLDKAINRALDIGIAQDKIIIDPGIGFGKNFQHNLLIIKALKELKVLGKPILIGTSRKSFIGKILKVNPQNRLFGSISSVCLAVINGANIVRVHDVKETKQALEVLDRILKVSYR